MARAILPIANGAYVSESLPLSAQQCINWYPHITEVASLNQESLRGTPGLYQAVTSGASITDACRGEKTFKSRLYVVNGPTLFRVNNDNTMTNLGQIESDARVTMVNNDSQLLILVPGGAGYIFEDVTDTLTEITDSDFRANGDPLYACFIDGYFVFTTDEKKFIISALNDGLSYNALDFGSAESSPDGVVIPFVQNNQLFIGGEYTIEAFNNIGGADFPFQRTGLFLSQGVFAPFSAVQSGINVLFIGGGEDESPAVWLLSGNATQKVSTQPIDDILLRLTADELSDVYAWSYGQAGHYFIGFALPDTCIVFDTTTGRWHERQSRVENFDGTISTISYRVHGFATAYGRLYVTDTQDGRVGIADLDTYTEYGSVIVRTIATQPFQNNMEPFFVPYLEATIESGVGNTSATDPQIRLQISRDGGKNWSDERSRSMGEIGQYSRRAVWRRNGRSSRFDVYRLIMSDPVKPVLIQLTAQIEGMDDAAA
jgi:hypothetical protein